MMAQEVILQRDFELPLFVGGMVSVSIRPISSALLASEFWTEFMDLF